MNILTKFKPSAEPTLLQLANNDFNSTDGVLDSVDEELVTINVFFTTSDDYTITIQQLHVMVFSNKYKLVERMLYCEEFECQLLSQHSEEGESFMTDEDELPVAGTDKDTVMEDIYEKIKDQDIFASMGMELQQIELSEMDLFEVVTVEDEEEFCLKRKSKNTVCDCAIHLLEIRKKLGRMDTQHFADT